MIATMTQSLAIFSDYVEASLTIARMGIPGDYCMDKLDGIKEYLVRFRKHFRHFGHYSMVLLYSVNRSSEYESQILATTLNLH